MPSTLYERIYAVVKTIPKGKVASYGSVAEAAGMLRGAQVVGWALRRLPLHSTDVPWQRVVAKCGRISIINLQATPSHQVELLGKEGVKVSVQSKELFITTPPWFIFPIK